MAFPDSDLSITVLAYLGADRTLAPGSWPAPTDLSTRLMDKEIAITRGRGAGQAVPQSAQCTLWLHNEAIGNGLGANAAGALTPLLATSTYYPNWDVGAPMKILVDSDARFSGFIADISEVIVPVVGGTPISAVKVTLGGVLRQLTQGADVLSPLSRVGRAFRVGATLPGWWSCEAGDGDLTSTPSGIVGGPAATVIAVPDGRPASSISADGLDGAAGAIDLSGGATLTGVLQYGGVLGTGLWAWEGGLQISSQSAGNRVVINTPDDLPYATLSTSGTGSITLTLTNGGTTNTLTGTATIADGKYHWVTIKVDATTFNSTVAIPTLYVDGVSVSLTGSVTVTAREVARFLVSNVDAVTQVFHWRYIYTASVTSAAALAYAGEFASERINRLCTQNSIPITYYALDDQVRLGPQETDTLVPILFSAQQGDRGMLTEALGTFGLDYRASAERYNLAAALTIDLNTYNVTEGDEDAVLAPVRNDQRMRNQWAISTLDGEAATYQDDAHIVRHGRFDDSDTVNVQDVAAARHDAGWRVREGTYDGLRYASLPLDLAANPSLIAAWKALELGDRIDRTNNPAVHPAGTTSMTFEGYGERMTRRSWTAAVSVEPFPPWQVDVLAHDLPADDGSDPIGWEEFDTCSLASGVNSSATSWSITCTPADTSTSTNFPRQHLIGGELVTVTASTGGTSPTWTVTRSVNGVTKSHSTGAAIVLDDPLILALS